VPGATVSRAWPTSHSRADVIERLRARRGAVRRWGGSRSEVVVTTLLARPSKSFLFHAIIVVTKRRAAKIKQPRANITSNPPSSAGQIGNPAADVDVVSLKIRVVKWDHPHWIGESRSRRSASFPRRFSPARPRIGGVDVIISTGSAKASSRSSAILRLSRRSLPWSYTARVTVGWCDDAMK
jgi:hypothetical protein